jgi:drug/metabolite transporter, DME family
MWQQTLPGARTMAAVTWPPLLALVASFAFAAAAVLVKRGLQHATPLAAVLVSVHFTAATVWLLAVATQPLAMLLTGRVWPFLVAGLAAPGLARVGLYLGVHRVGASRASSLASCTPLFAVIMAILVLGERPSWGLLAGAAAIVVGGVLLSHRGHDDRTWRRRDLVFPILGALGFAFRDNLSRWGFGAFPYPLLAATTATAASVAVMWLVVLAVRGTGAVGVSWPGLRLLALSGLAEGVAYLTMWQALMLGEVSVVSPLVNCHAIFTVALAWLFLRDLERVTWRIAVAAALVVAGVGLVIRFGTS